MKTKNKTYYREGQRLSTSLGRRQQHNLICDRNELYSCMEGKNAMNHRCLERDWTPQEHRERSQIQSHSADHCFPGQKSGDFQSGDEKVSNHTANRKGNDAIALVSTRATAGVINSLIHFPWTKSRRFPKLQVDSDMAAGFLTHF